MFWPLVREHQLALIAQKKKKSIPAQAKKHGALVSSGLPRPLKLPFQHFIRCLTRGLEGADGIAAPAVPVLARHHLQTAIATSKRKQLELSL